MSALRVARGFTGRDAILKFDGCYHGHADSLLVKAGSGAITFGVPDSGGVPADLARHTLTVAYNDLEAVRRVFDARGDSIAAIIVEAVAGNMGVVPPRPGFLQGLREVTARHGALLIFDEVITGFRVGWSGAQGLYGVRPDLTCLGKIIGGGLPVGAYGGRHDVMETVAPLGPVYQAGTLSGNPLAVTAGIETLKLCKAPGFYEGLEATARRLADGLAAAGREAGVAVRGNRVGSMLTAFFTDREVVDYATALLCAEAVGAIRYANEATLEYLKTRQQFGVPIGSFQALQHRMVDMVISYEQARSMACLGCVKVDTAAAAERRRAVSAAKIKVADACRHVSQESVQLHGGMGMTEELKVSHTFRRLTMIAQTFGDAEHHLERFAASAAAGG